MNIAAMPQRDRVATVIAAAAEDIATLARLLDREPDAELIVQLAGAPSRDWFGLSVTGEGAALGLALLDQYMKQATATDASLAAAVEELAADYADLFLTFGKRLAANESFWLTDDHIERQEPMFDVRGWYAHYGVAAENWRMRPDDHLVLQLAFVARLLQSGNEAARLDAGRFLDRHLLRWSKDLFGGVARRADTAFFGGLALVSEAILEAVRTMLVEITGEPRKEETSSPEIGEARPALTPFVPGTAPSW